MLEMVAKVSRPVFLRSKEFPWRRRPVLPGILSIFSWAFSRMLRASAKGKHTSSSLLMATGRKDRWQWMTASALETQSFPRSF